jgi:three-Cys-motif partner protein
MEFNENFGLANVPSNDNWGGQWTQDKIEIFIKYLKAYLTIMKKHDYYELWYFDGFAGSGQIYDKAAKAFFEGIALKVMAIEEPKSFDHYYFVELDKAKAESLKIEIDTKFPKKKDRRYIVSTDCNEKVTSFAGFLKKYPKKKRGLAILDPYGMALKWESLEEFKGLYCDMWILVPTGIAFNRLLKKDGQISEAWMLKLTNSLGLTEEQIKQHFYKEKTSLTLFGDEIETSKSDKSIQKLIDIYSERLSQIWKFVSKPYEMKNSKGSIMFHFIFASQIEAGVKIADAIIDSKNKK